MQKQAQICLETGGAVMPFGRLPAAKAHELWTSVRFAITTVCMFGLGLGEILLIFCAALIFIGPKRLPEVGKKIGELFRQVKDTADTVKRTVTEDLDDDDSTS